jgi:hypothetical protein
VASVTELRISQLAGRSGLPASTLRFYESAGLLPAGRTPALHLEVRAPADAGGLLAGLFGPDR